MHPDHFILMVTSYYTAFTSKRASLLSGTGRDTHGTSVLSRLLKSRTHARIKMRDFTSCAESSLLKLNGHVLNVKASIATFTYYTNNLEFASQQAESPKGVSWQQNPEVEQEVDSSLNSSTLSKMNLFTIADLSLVWSETLARFLDQSHSNAYISHSNTWISHSILLFPVPLCMLSSQQQKITKNNSL